MMSLFLCAWSLYRIITTYTHAWLGQYRRGYPHCHQSHSPRWGIAGTARTRRPKQCKFWWISVRSKLLVLKIGSSTNPHIVSCLDRKTHENCWSRYASTFNSTKYFQSVRRSLEHTLKNVFWGVSILLYMRLGWLFVSLFLLPTLIPLNFLNRCMVYPKVHLACQVGILLLIFFPNGWWK